MLVCVCSSIVEEGLSYRFHASWPFVLQILGCFYRIAGKQAHPIMIKVKPILIAVSWTVLFAFLRRFLALFALARRFS